MSQGKAYEAVTSIYLSIYISIAIAIYLSIYVSISISISVYLLFRFSKSGLPTCRQTGEGFCVLKWERVRSIGGPSHMLKLKIQSSPSFTSVTKWLHYLWNISVCMKSTLQTLAYISFINNAFLMHTRLLKREKWNGHRVAKCCSGSWLPWWVVSKTMSIQL